MQCQTLTTRTFAGGTFPAAVICPAKKRGNWSAASMIARYPAIFAWELRISYVWARESILGTQSKAKTSVFCAVRSSCSFLFMDGCIKLTNVLLWNFGTSSSFGGRIFVNISASTKIWASSRTMAPDLMYAASLNEAFSPAEIVQNDMTNTELV